MNKESKSSSVESPREIGVFFSVTNMDTKMLSDLSACVHMAEASIRQAEAWLEQKTQRERGIA